MKIYVRCTTAGCRNKGYGKLNPSQYHIEIKYQKPHYIKDDYHYLTATCGLCANNCEITGVQF